MADDSRDETTDGRGLKPSRWRRYALPAILLADDSRDETTDGRGLKPSRWRRYALPAILLAAALLRLPGIDPSSLPQHPDEYNFVYWPLLALMGDADPGVFYYPHFHYYLLALLNGLALLPDLVAGPASLQELLVLRFFWWPETALVVGRLASLAFAVGSVGLVYAIGRRCLDRAGALLAALLLAVCVLHVRQSPLAGADVPMTFWALGAVLASLRLLRAPTLRAHLLAGALVGLAGATKYHGAAAAIAVAAAHLSSRPRPPAARLLAAAVAAVALFAVATPYCLLDWNAFAAGLSAVASHVEAGRGDLGPAWRYHALTTLRLSYGWVGWMLTGAGLVLAARRRRPEDVVLLASFAAFFAVIGAGHLPFLRYALPLMGLQALLMARCFGLRPRRIGWAALLVFLEPVYGSLQVARLQATEDTRLQARRWLETNAPAGSVCCNFGGWAGDPPARTFEDIWWKVSQLAGSTAAVDVGRALRYLEPHAPPSPFYSYVVQHGNRRFASGRLDLVSGFDCDYVLVHDHALGYSTIDSGFRSALPRLASRLASFGEPIGSPTGARYDPIDAYFVPVAGFADVRRPGPGIEIWQTRRVRGGRPETWTARHLFARAFLRGAASLLDQGHAGASRHMLGQALQAAGRTRDDWLRTEAARLRRRLGEAGTG